MVSTETWIANTTGKSAAGALAGTEILRLGQLGASVKLALSVLKTFFSASPALVTPNLGTPSAGNLSSCTAYPFSSLTGSASVAQLGDTTYTTRQINVVVRGVDFSATNTDTAFNIPLPTGFTRYRYLSAIISHASASIAGATCGVFTAAAGGGTALTTGATAVTITVTAEDTSGNIQVLAAANGALSLTDTSLFFRVQTSVASGTADVTFNIEVLS